MISLSPVLKWASVASLLLPAPAIADCGCEGDTYIVAKAKTQGSTNTTEIHIFGSHMGISVDRDDSGKVVTDIEQIKQALRQSLKGIQSPAIMRSSTFRPGHDNAKGEAYTVIAYSSNNLSEADIERIKSLKAIKVGCAAPPPRVREDIFEIFSERKPYRIRRIKDHEYGFDHHLFDYIIDGRLQSVKVPIPHSGCI